MHILGSKQAPKNCTIFGERTALIAWNSFLNSSIVESVLDAFCCALRTLIATLVPGSMGIDFGSLCTFIETFKYSCRGSTSKFFREFDFTVVIRGDFNSKLPMGDQPTLIIGCPLGVLQLTDCLLNIIGIDIYLFFSSSKLSSTYSLEFAFKSLLA